MDTVLIKIVGGGRMNENLKNLFRGYIKDIEAVNRLDYDSIINTNQKNEIKAKILDNIICDIHDEVTE